LVDHFIAQNNHRLSKNVVGVTDKVMQDFMSYSWPGNVRELEHLIERACLLTNTKFIEDSGLKNRLANSSSLERSGIKTIAENEHDYIVHVLRQSKGRIWGNGGAAELLKIRPTTLNSKIKKMNIDPKGF
jgi:formate hydrogenlyase transcriptional activator